MRLVGRDPRRQPYGVGCGGTGVLRFADRQDRRVRHGSCRVYRQDEIRFGRVAGRGRQRECRSSQIRSGRCGLREGRCHHSLSRGAPATPRRSQPGDRGMTVSELHTTDIKTKWPVLPKSLIGLALLFPALAFLTIFLVLPSLILLGYNVLTQSQGGDISLPLTTGSYQRLI